MPKKRGSERDLTWSCVLEGCDRAVRTDNRGTRVYKEHKHSMRRIDLAVCAIMAHDRVKQGAPMPAIY
jgi:hypothetical protein